jgi:hypothetical protein
MKKYLSIALFCAIFVVQLLCLAEPALAVNPDDWVFDEDVTFAGQLAKRSSHLLNWVIEHHQWANVTPSGPNPFDAIWVPIRNIVYGVMGLFILVAAFLLITTRGKSLTIRKFIPRFILVLVLVTLSLALAQFIFQIGDIIQGFFLKKPGTQTFISDNDLLAVSFEYKDFEGFRKFGPEYKESVFMSTLMVKLTAMTYYAMFIILIIRKIILWFFLIVSPIFPLLLMFYPLRNTAKIWLGEFFRWLLYGPLFAIFLAGLVALWTQGVGIPLDLQNVPCENPPADASAAEFQYPTSISILLGGPCQQVTLFNSLNTTDSFIQYVVALLMLWMVIIVPFILLKIFLDYFKDFNFSDSNLMKYIVNSSSPLLTRYGLMSGAGRGAPPGGFPPPAGSTGRAMTIPVEGAAAIASSPAINEIQKHMQQTAEKTHELAEAYKQAATSNSSSVSQIASNAASSIASQAALSGTEAGSATAATAVAAQQAIAEILNLTSLSIPTMRDVASYEASLISSGSSSGTGSYSASTSSSVQTQEAHQITEALKRIGGKSNLTTPGENTRFTQIREKLTTEASKGNAVASSILSASVGGGAGLPAQNAVQAVNLDDYEEVKRLWVQNFQKLDVPPDGSGQSRSRKEWLESEIKQIPEVIELLLSGDPKQVEKGKNMVAKILPFLLLGGFTKEEIIAYLKAKLEAAKQVLGDVVAGEKDKEEQVEVDRKVEEKPKTMELAEEIKETSDTKPEFPKLEVPEKSSEPDVAISPDHPAALDKQTPIPDDLKPKEDQK